MPNWLLPENIADILPSEARKIEELRRQMLDNFRRYGYELVMPPMLEYLEQVLFYAQMASEAGYFTISDVATNLNAKLIRRHPHIFGGEEAADSAAVLRNWEQIKRGEKSAGGEKGGSMLDDVPRSMPAMLEAGKLGSRAAKVGFDWPNAEGLFDKLQEEIAELQAELRPMDISRSAVEEELGDLLFTAVNLARHLKVDPESALRGTNAKFRKRFVAMESVAGGRAALEAATPERLEELWSEAKRTTREEPGR